VVLAVDASAALRVDSLAVTLYAPDGTKLVNADTARQGRALRLEEGRSEVVVRIDALHLNPGPYQVGLWLANNANGVVLDHVERAFEVLVEDPAARGFGASPRDDGYVPCSFETRVAEPSLAGGAAP
jgi:citrate lyase beta subunit